MILSKCPLRISLIGGASDLEEFIEEEGYGSVISFPCSLYVYNTIFTDKNGYNRNSGKYIIEYTRTEKTKSISKIKNDIAREVLKHFNSDPLKISFYSDIFSHGSGLASSSAYTVSVIRALSLLEKKRISNREICALALDLERKFNPITGRQDTYGCGIGGLKRMLFFKSGINIIKKLDDSILFNYDMHLIYTGVKRSSTKVLKSINLNKVKESLPLVEEMNNAITKNKEKDFFRIINDGWKKKKKTSNLIVENKTLLELDGALSSCGLVKAHKLCGAGGGGYFLTFTEKDTDLNRYIKNFNKISFKIQPDKKGVTYSCL